MSKTEKTADLPLSEGEVDSTIEEELPKKRKVEQKKSSIVKLKNEAGEIYYELTPSRRVTLRSFRGKALIDIREFYEAEKGVMKPGKKGISLSVEQFKTLADLIDFIKGDLEAQ